MKGLGFRGFFRVCIYIYIFNKKHRGMGATGCPFPQKEVKQKIGKMETWVCGDIWVDLKIMGPFCL